MSINLQMKRLIVQETTMKNKFVKSYAGIIKDPKGQKILEENFHFFKLKSSQEKMRVIKRNFGVNVYIPDDEDAG